MSEPRVLVTCPGEHIALVTLNRPDKANAVDAALTEALSRAVHALEDDADVRAVILAAAGCGIFCAGADLAVVLAGQQAALFPADGGFAGFVQVPRRKPWIAAVDGAALAGGFEIVLACDLVIATPRARFGLPEVKWGLLAAAGGVQLLPKRIPPALAREMILTGQPIDAATALRLGLVNRVVEPDALIAEAMAMARAIAANAAGSVQTSVTLIRAVLDEHAADIWGETERLGHQLAAGPEAADRIGQFVNRRSNG